MVQLLLKDLRIQKKYIVIGFLFVGFLFFVMGAFEGVPLSVPAAIYSHFLIVLASKMDERNNNGRMLASLPVRRRDIVTAKYVGVGLFMALAFLLTGFWRAAAAMVFPAGELPWFSPQSIIATILALLVFYAIYFPLFFAFGPRLAQILDLVVLLSVGGFAVVVLRILEWNHVDFGSVLRHAWGQPGLTVWSAGVCAALLLISWSASVAFSERRSF